MPFSSNPLLAPMYETPAGDPHDRRIPVVSLVRSGRPIEEGVRLHHNIDRYGYILGREAEGLGVAPVELQSAPLAGGGSVFRHARLTEGEVFLPITLSAASPSHLPGMFDRLVQLVQPGRGEFYDIVVFDPYGYEARTRSVVFESGLTDPVRVSSRVWKTSLTGRYMDPFWYGRERVLSRRLGGVAKKFITAKQGEPDLSAPPFIAFDWEGTPHASQTIVSRNGREVMRNLIVNGDFENEVTGWETYNSTAASTTSWNHQMWGGLGGSLLHMTVGTSSRYGDVRQQLGPVSAGEWVGVSAYMASDADMRIRIQLSWQSAAEDTTWTSPGWFEDAEFYPGTWVHFASEAPFDADNVQLQLQADTFDTSVSGKRMWADRVVAVAADSERKALDATREYFDGDSPNVPAQIDGYEFPFFPILLGGSTIQQKYELMIQGDAPAYWDAVIRGPGQDFTLRNQDGEGIFIEGEIDEPIVIVNRPQQQDITLADGTPIWERLDTGKGHDDFFMLEPGENVLEITMVGATLESDISFRYREAFYHSIGGA